MQHPRSLRKRRPVSDEHYGVLRPQNKSSTFALKKTSDEGGGAHRKSTQKMKN